MSPPGQHYFSASPSGPQERRTVTVALGGRAVTVATASGVFSADGLDLGTSVLLREAPDPPATGHLLDLGCGWGPLALALANLSPNATVWGVDVNQRAVALLRENATALGLGGVQAVTPDEVPADVAFSAIWSNPPVRIGKPALHDLLLTWLPRLCPSASAFLVVQRNLGSDSLQTWLSGTLGREFEVARFASAKGFRVLRVLRLPEPDLAPA